MAANGGRQRPRPPARELPLRGGAGGPGGAVVRGGRRGAELPGGHAALTPVPWPQPAVPGAAGLRTEDGLPPGTANVGRIMAQDKEHVGDALQELLDGRLPSGTRREVEAHLEECERCRREWQALIWTKQLLAEQREATLVPEAMEAKLLAALDAEDRSAKGR